MAEGTGRARTDGLAALLEEIDGLRRRVGTDLSRAASAVEAGAVGLAAGVLEQDRREVAETQRRALEHLARLRQEGPRTRSPRDPVALPQRRPAPDESVVRPPGGTAPSASRGRP